MRGLMQDWPLLCQKIIDHAALCHGDGEIISRSVEGPLHRISYADLRIRALKVAQRLDRDGIRLGDRVATLAWNTWRHLEAWYGIMGLGAIYHTINPRLYPEQIAWIANHAEDRILMLDLTFVPLIEKLAPELRSIERYILLTDRAHMPATTLPNALCYEDWLAEANGDFAWKTFDENTAAGLCYTSGTTGNPKGVLYSHRSNVLHALMASMPDMLGTSSSDVVLPIVPMFHANCWGYALAVPMAGGTLVMPGAKLDGASVCELFTDFGVTCTAGVPTVFLMMLQHLEQTGKRLPDLKKVIIGGSAAPRSMIETFEDVHNVEVRHAWGMTEMSPLGTVCSLKAGVKHLAGAAKLDVKSTQGYSPFMVELKITGDDGACLPRDGKTPGRLKTSGPAIAARYFREDSDVLDEDGFFDTGDVATIDPQGYMRITDRSKDVIKSGGEWISSIALENLAVGYSKIAEAAVIGIPHPKWHERPLLIVVLKPGESATREEILAFLAGKIAKWWLPDDVVFVTEIPHTATGKILKTALRDRFKSHVPPTAAA